VRDAEADSDDPVQGKVSEPPPLGFGEEDCLH